MHETFKDHFIKKWQKNEVKKEMQPVQQHTEKASRQNSALATASLLTNTPSREFIRVIKMKVLKLGI